MPRQYQDSFLPAVQQLTAYFQSRQKDDEERFRRYRMAELSQEAAKSFSAASTPDALAAAQSKFAMDVASDPANAYLGLTSKDVTSDLAGLIQSKGQQFIDRRQAEDHRASQMEKMTRLGVAGQATDDIVKNAALIGEAEANLTTNQTSVDMSQKKPIVIVSSYLPTGKAKNVYQLSLAQNADGYQFFDGTKSVSTESAIKDYGVDMDKVVAAIKGEREEKRHEMQANLAAQRAHPISGLNDYTIEMPDGTTKHSMGYFQGGMMYHLGGKPFTADEMEGAFKGQRGMGLEESDSTKLGKNYASAITQNMMLRNNYAKQIGSEYKAWAELNRNSDQKVTFTDSNGKEQTLMLKDYLKTYKKDMWDEQDETKLKGGKDELYFELAKGDPVFSAANPDAIGAVSVLDTEISRMNYGSMRKLPYSKVQRRIAETAQAWSDYWTKTDPKKKSTLQDFYDMSPDEQFRQVQYFTPGFNQTKPEQTQTTNSFTVSGASKDTSLVDLYNKHKKQ